MQKVVYKKSLFKKQETNNLTFTKKDLFGEKKVRYKKKKRMPKFKKETL